MSTLEEIQAAHAEAVRNLREVERRESAAISFSYWKMDQAREELVDAFTALKQADPSIIARMEQEREEWLQDHGMQQRNA